MERFDFTFRTGLKPAFEDVPTSHKKRLFDVDYIHLKGRQHGDFFITRHGWPVMDSLLPQHWFTGRRFCKVGRALAGATGAVYRVPVPHPARDYFALVVKFSRFCQHVGATAVDPGMNLSAEQIFRIESSHFLSPFEEIGNLEKLRKAAGRQILTKAPLAIYSPPSRYLDWQLGREPSLKSFHSGRLLNSQKDLPEEERMDFDWERQYILLYHFINGLDAEQAVDKGLIPMSTMSSLAREARDAMAAHGWEVMDHKPRHVILREDKDGKLVVKNGRPIWALIDYELLYPLSSEEHPVAG